MTITTGYYYAMMNAFTETPRLQRHETRKMIRKNNSKKDCDELCEKFINCLESCSYTDELSCFNLAVDYRNCLKKMKKS